MDTKTRKYYYRRLALTLEWIVILNEEIERARKSNDVQETERLTHLLGLEKQLSSGLRRAINENRESLIIL